MSISLSSTRPVRPLKKGGVFGAAVLLAAGCLPAQSIAADKYVLDPSHSHVQFSFDRFGFNSIIGEFRDVEAVLMLDEDNPENSSVTATIGVASAVSGDDTRDEHMAGPVWLNAEAFPTISFESTNVDQSSETQATVTGNLTLRGVTAPVVLDVRLNKIDEDRVTKKRAAGFSATGTLKRSAFGLETALGFIGDDIDFRIEALAHRSE